MTIEEIKEKYKREINECVKILNENKDYQLAIADYVRENNDNKCALSIVPKTLSTGFREPESIKYKDLFDVKAEYPIPTHEIAFAILELVKEQRNK